MKYTLLVWNECWEDFVRYGLPYEETNDGLVANYTPDQIIGLSDRFDLMVKTKGNEKVITVSPLGRGFGQRG